MLSEKEFNNLKWEEFTDLTRLVGATITHAEPLKDGLSLADMKDVGVTLELAYPDGAKAVVLINCGEGEYDGIVLTSIAEVFP